MRLEFVLALEVLVPSTSWFKNNLGNFLSWAILELLLVVVIETKICEDGWWW